MNTTKILGEAVGIQSQGVVDRTETQTKVGLTSAIIIGQFKRGRVDRPMTIHNGNIRGQLGYEPNNPYYMAVQDCLDTGVPSIQVLRVGGIDNGNLHISCDGATDDIRFDDFQGLWDIQLDDVVYRTEGSLVAPYIRSNFSHILAATDSGWMKLANIDSVPHRIRLFPLNVSGQPNSFTAPTNNPTFMEHEDGSLSFCLVPLVDLYTPAVLALNPVAYYKMDEPSGSVVNDSSPSQFHGSIIQPEAVEYQNAVIRKCSKGALGFGIKSGTYFAAAECVVSDAVAGDVFRRLAGTDRSCTIAFWFKPNGTKTYNYPYGYLTNSAMGYNNYRMFAVNGDPLQAQTAANTNTIHSNESLASMIGKTQFIVWRKNAATQTYTLYINGEFKSINGADSVEDAGDGFHFPVGYGYQSYGVVGWMSDMSVFNYALSDAQISNLYDLGKLD